MKGLLLGRQILYLLLLHILSSKPPWFQHPKIISWGLNRIKLLVMHSLYISVVSFLFHTDSWEEIKKNEGRVEGRRREKRNKGEGRRNSCKRAIKKVTGLWPDWIPTRWRRTIRNTSSYPAHSEMSLLNRKAHNDCRECRTFSLPALWKKQRWENMWFCTTLQVLAN